MLDIIMSRLYRGEFVLIAEIGVNYYDIAAKLHISLIDAAKFMILSAKNAGVHAVKFQSYKANTLAAKESPAYWDTNEETTASQYELFRKYDRFGDVEYKELAVFCEHVGIEFCSTPFDLAAADYLEPLMNVYKISSSDVTNIPFIEYIAGKHKPILLSTGAANLGEIQAAIQAIRRHNDKELVLLHCVLEYPTPYTHANLEKIAALKRAFPDVYIGYSDHTKPDDSAGVIQVAHLLGAQLVEKHFTVDKGLSGNDHYHAMDPHDAEKILRKIVRVGELRGEGTLRCLPSEAAARRNARRSLVAAQPIPQGAAITAKMLTWKRPGIGISPNELEQLLRCSASRDIAEDEILTWDMLEEIRK